MDAIAAVLLFVGSAHAAAFVVVGFIIRHDIRAQRHQEVVDRWVEMVK